MVVVAPVSPSAAMMGSSGVAQRPEEVMKERLKILYQARAGR